MFLMVKTRKRGRGRGGKFNWVFIVIEGFREQLLLWGL